MAIKGIAAAGGSVVAVVGIAVLRIAGLWLFVDIFLIPGIIRDRNARLAMGLTGHYPGY